jgi:hypothetical protein
MKRAAEEKSYEQLSPFELKDKLIEMAENSSEKLMLNAGRGRTGSPQPPDMPSSC